MWHDQWRSKGGPPRAAILGGNFGEGGWGRVMKEPYMGEE